MKEFPNISYHLYHNGGQNFRRLQTVAKYTPRISTIFSRLRPAIIGRRLKCVAFALVIGRHAVLKIILVMCSCMYAEVWVAIAWHPSFLQIWHLYFCADLSVSEKEKGKQASYQPVRTWVKLQCVKATLMRKVEAWKQWQKNNFDCDDGGSINFTSEKFQRNVFFVKKIKVYLFSFEKIIFLLCWWKINNFLIFR